MRQVLTIAGSDSGGGAGIQADLKTFAAQGVYGMSVITALTAQNTQGVTAVHNVPVDIVKAQLDAVFSDIRVDAVKIGMLSQPEIIETVVQALERYRPPLVVVDPVMVAKSGHRLLQPAAVRVLIDRLIPLAHLITPNIPETQVLVDRPVLTLADMEAAAEDLLLRGARAVLVKGGHLDGEPTDVLASALGVTHFAGQRRSGKHTHGTGCSLSSAIAALMARGQTLNRAVGEAKAFVERGIQEGLAIGQGIGPIHHFAALYERAGVSI